MKELIVNGVSLDLPPGFNIRMVRNNSMFTDEFLEGDYSFPIQLPGTEKNRQFFSFLELPESRASVPDLEAQYIENDIILVKGALQVKKASRSRIECYILSGLSRLAKIKDKLIGDLDYGGERIFDGAFQSIIWLLTAPDGGGNVSFVFGQFGLANITIPWNTDANTTLNDLKTAILALVPTKYPFQTVTVNITGNQIEIIGEWASGYPKLWAYPYSGSWTAGTDATGPQHIADVLKDHMNNVMATPENYDYLFFPIFNTDSGLFDYSAIAAPFYFPEIIINYFYSGSFVTAYQTGGPGVITVRAPVCPFPKVLYVLKQILKAGSYRVDGSVYQDDEFLNLVIYSTFALHKADFESYFKQDQYQVKYDVADSLPKITVSEFLQALRKTFGFHYFFSDSRLICNIQTFEELLSSNKIIDWSDKVAPVPDILIPEKPGGYTLQFNNDSNDQAIAELVPGIEEKRRIYPDVNEIADLAGVTGELNDIIFVKKEKALYSADIDSSGNFVGWEFYSVHLHPMVIGEGSTNHDTGAGTLVMHHGPIGVYYATTEQWVVPYAKQKLNPVKSEEPYQDFSLRFLFYRGIVETDPSNWEYPLGTFEDRDFDGNEITGANTNLIWEGDKGLYNRFWKKYLAWRESAKEMDVLIYLTELDYINLNFGRKVQIHGVNFFIKTVDISFPIKAPARVTLVKC